MADMKHYVSDKEAYVGGVYYKPGVPFVTDAEPGDGWEKVTPKAAAIMETSQDAVPDDADLEALPATALKAVAFMRRVTGIADLDGDGLKDAIRASYEPKL